jgi:outer membrane lipoprotein-sorting protein
MATDPQGRTGGVGAVREPPLPFRVAGLLLVALTMSLADIAAQSLTVDEVVAKFLDAKGGAEKLRAINTVKTSGRMKARGGDVPVTTWAKRPNMMRRENTQEGQTFVIAFDGKTVWAINPMTSPAPREITGPQTEMTRQDADDFDTALLDYQKKGYKVELVRSEPVGGVAMHHVRVTKQNGRVQDIYLNAETFLESKISMEVEQGGRKATVATEFSNYKAIEGIMVPFSLRQTFNGQIAAEVVYEQVQFNLPLDDGLFKMPAK